MPYRCSGDLLYRVEPWPLLFWFVSAGERLKGTKIKNSLWALFQERPHRCSKKAVRWPANSVDLRHSSLDQKQVLRREGESP